MIGLADWMDLTRGMGPREWALAVLATAGVLAYWWVLIPAIAWLMGWL